MTEFITLNHGSGGKMTQELISHLFARHFGMQGPMTDSAILETNYNNLAFSTDAYVVDPVFFPGGDIGKLAVCGTVNDLSVSGAKPVALSASFIIEEGFPYADLERIVISMANEARIAGVKVVAGDTKVVEKGKCDKIFITTSGIGIIDREYLEIGPARTVSPGDRIIINGCIASHAAAVLIARKQLNFNADIRSDCASLNYLVSDVLDTGVKVKFMRDLTRGGLATVLNELSGMTGCGISVSEEDIPMEESVRGFCEILGFDPLYMANEGKLIMVVDPAQAEETLKVLRMNSLGSESRVIGEVIPGKGGRVVLKTITGGSRMVGMLSGTQLPRIC
jgi:hydrogenase expression/formation protein HypE